MSKLKLYDFQEEAVRDLMNGKRFVIANCGAGKTAMLFNWLDRVGKKKVLVITTASKVKSGDFITEADKFNGEEWRNSLDRYEIVSWHMLSKWVSNNILEDFSEWAIAFDEVAKAGAGVSSAMGKSFLALTKECDDWTGYTGTPGDTWIKFYPYFTACKKVRNKTSFQREFCNVATYRGFPEIVSYRNTDTLDKWWKEISTAPDTTEMEKQLPKETHKTITFKKPRDYNKVLKTSKTLDGDPLESNMALCHYLRQVCDTKDKQEWLTDWLTELSEPAVIFYNYNCEAESIIEACKKAKKGKVWLINGQAHEIPTKDTIGKDDIIVAHYLSGGEGLNLQFCHYWLAYSPNYSFSTSIQARGRIKRIGQTRPMYFYYFDVENTIESDVYKALKNKSDFSEDVWMASRK